MVSGSEQAYIVPSEQSSKVAAEENTTTKPTPTPRSCMKPGILHPRTSRFLSIWDAVIGIALAFTALITPYEVAFLAVKIDPLFVINRCADFAFLVDIYINFRLAYFSNKQKKWIVDRREIRNHYLRTWFSLDVISTLPYDLVDIIVGNDGDSTSGGAADNLKILRILKILKLFKLLRIMKSARIFRQIEKAMGLSNANSTLVKHLLVFGMVIHWLACLWGVGPSFEGDGPTWIKAHGHEDQDSIGMYLLGLYFR